MSETTRAGRRFRFSGSIIYFRLLSLLYLIPFSVLPITLFALMYFILRDPDNRIVGLVLLLVVGPLFLISLVFITFQLVSVFGSILFSYVEVSADGLAYRSWPSYGIRCKWEDIERLGQRRVFGMINNDVLYARDIELFGWKWPGRLRQLLGMKPINFIPLTGISGWPRGPLADELTARIPDIVR